jgi:hypothetical protein
MNIGLNGSALRAPLTGVGQYVHHLAKGLLATPSLHTYLFNGKDWDTSLPASTTASGTDVAVSQVAAPGMGGLQSSNH